jgi:hypothetical protein
MTTTNPLDGPFPAGRELTDYRDMPGYAIPVSAEQPSPGLATKLRQEAMGR